MRMPWLATVVLGAILIAYAPFANAAKPRHGVIADIQPIENRGDDESEQTKKNRKLGSRLGGALGGLAGLGIIGKSDSTAGQLAGRVAVDHGDEIGGEVAAKAGGPGPTTRYMVKVKLDTGKTLVLTQLRQQVDGLKVGSRVRVEGRGDDALIYAD